MNKRRAIISSLLTILLVGGVAWAFGVFSSPDPAIAELQAMESQMWDQSLPEAQRNQLRTDFRQRMDSMTRDQRRAFFDANRDQWDNRMRQRMDEFFTMSKADQQKRLDEILNRMVQSQNSRQQNSNRQGAGQGRNGRTMTDAQRDERSKRRLDRTTPKMRAQFTEFRKQLDARAQQRGIKMGDPRGPGFGGSRPGA